LALTLHGDASRLVIDGLITQDPGPYEVKLFYSNALDKDQKTIRYETRASVWINSSMGESEQLTQVAPGIYQTRADGLRGQVGTSYSIRILTDEGKEYVSAPQLLADGGSISKVYSEFQEDAINGDDPAAAHDVFNVYADCQGEPGKENLFRWRWWGTYTARSYPELHDTLPPGYRNPIPWPLPCSGYIYTRAGLTKVGECTCCICYATEYSPSALVSHNGYSNDYRFNKVSMAKIPATGMRFYERYYIQVEQLRLSDEVYKFWSLVEAQQEAQGSIFQPNAVRIKGNVHLASDNNDVLLGVFTVAGISRNSVFIERGEIPYEPDPIGMIGDDCRHLFENATTQKPSFW
jgi:hypothetical protein